MTFKASIAFFRVCPTIRLCKFGANDDNWRHTVGIFKHQTLDDKMKYETKSPTVFLSIATLAFAVAGWSTFSNQQESKQESETIISILSAQTKAWNAGDLEKFMQTYWKDDKLSFSSGGKTTFGWQATLDNYKKGYAPPKEMGTLNFDGLQVSIIESKSALVLGNWHLKFKDDSTRDGNFSLVIKKLESGWKIIHDHSSELKKKDDEDEGKTKTKKQ